MTDIIDPRTAPAALPFQRQDAIGLGGRSAFMVGGAGLFFSAIQNTLSKTNNGAMGVFSRYGSTAFLFTAMGGTYGFVTAASANLRGSNDFLNNAVGGAAAGAILGAGKRTMPAVVGNAALLGVTLGVMGYVGTGVFGRQDVRPEEGRWPTKEEMRKRYRRPLNETINELGEGRGIYAPGYEERRKDRLKEAYGIEVPGPHWEHQQAPTPMKSI